MNKGIVIADQSCPKCRRGMIILRACCSIRRSGWRWMRKCVYFKCGYKIGHQRNGKLIPPKGEGVGVIGGKA